MLLTACGSGAGPPQWRRGTCGLMTGMRRPLACNEHHKLCGLTAILPQACLHTSVMRLCAHAGNLAEGQPKDGCVALASSEALQGSLLILERGQCMFAAKVSWL